MIQLTLLLVHVLDSTTVCGGVLTLLCLLWILRFYAGGDDEGTLIIMESHQHPESFSRGNRILMISFHAFHLGSFLCFVAHFYTYALSPLICNTMLHLNLLYSKM